MIMAVSESDLHAYVDGELTGAQLNRVVNEVLGSKELFDHVCALQALKQLFRQAYKTVPVAHEA
jgi:anti-sigma factor RsiW